MILILLTDAWKITDALDVELLEQLRITDIGPFEDLGCAKSTTAENDHLASLDSTSLANKT
jgi:hypothetical protein